MPCNRLFFRLYSHILVSILVCSTAVSIASAQTFPTYNYRNILFPFDKTTGADNCIIEISEGNYENIEQFEKNIAIRRATKKDQVILLPHFNKTYTWRAKYMHKNKPVFTDTTLHEFAISYSKYTDTNFYRWRILKQAPAQYSQMLVFVDYLRGLFDMNGNAMWYLPNIPGIVDDNTLVRDLKPTTAGTITFLTYNGAYEIDYTGKILWAAPNDGKVSGGKTENYHHEFTRLSNGRYMLTGTESINKNNGRDNMVLQYETLVEYDKANNITWQWKASEHLPDSLVFAKRDTEGRLNTSMHLNSFYVDEVAGIIYLGFRDLSSIVTLTYPSGKILNIYNGIQKDGTRLFKSQHSCRVNAAGNIYLYSNNNAGKHEKEERNCISTIAVLKKTGNTLQKTWEFSCDIDTNALSCTNSGGSIAQLKNGDYLVSMGAVNRNFIVNTKKQVLWNAITEMKNGDNKWQAAGTYRISFIESNDVITNMLHRAANK